MVFFYQGEHTTDYLEGHAYRIETISNVEADHRESFSRATTGSFIQESRSMPVLSNIRQNLQLPTSGNSNHATHSSISGSSTSHEPHNSTSRGSTTSRAATIEEQANPGSNSGSSKLTVSKINREKKKQKLARKISQGVTPVRSNATGEENNVTSSTARHRKRATERRIAYLMKNKEK